MTATATISPDEIAKFAKMADSWWDPTGAFRPLHKFNPERIRFVRDQPRTAWNTVAPEEYGFYSNVNPNADHPRWSQASERRIGEGGFFAPKRKTLMFNGYDQVASLYSGMDLKKYF